VTQLPRINARDFAWGPAVSSSSLPLPVGSGAISISEKLARLEWLAELLDSRFRIPGTNIRFGLDPLTGVIPVVGDFIGALLSLYLVIGLAGLGLPTWTKFRMLVNVLADFFVGSLPILGDILDVAFKSNRMNVALARRVLTRQRRL